MRINNNAIEILQYSDAVILVCIYIILKFPIAASQQQNRIICHAEGNIDQNSLDPTDNLLTTVSKTRNVFVSSFGRRERRQIYVSSATTTSVVTTRTLYKHAGRYKGSLFTVTQVHLLEFCRLRLPKIEEEISPNNTRLHNLISGEVTRFFPKLRKHPSLS